MGFSQSTSPDRQRYASDDWRACFAEFGPRLLLFARQIAPCIADAEDAVQEGFVRFWRKGGLRASENQGLLFAAVRSAALDHLRRESRRRKREQTAFDENFLPGVEMPHEPSLSARDDPQADAFELERAIQDLPVEQREVLVLKVWGELTYEEIGVALSIPANTAASRYRYALGHLKKLLTAATHERRH